MGPVEVGRKPVAIIDSLHKRRPFIHAVEYAGVGVADPARGSSLFFGGHGLYAVRPALALQELRFDVLPQQKISAWLILHDIVGLAPVSFQRIVKYRVL